MVFNGLLEALNGIFWALVGIGICIFLHMGSTTNWLRAIHERLDRIPRKSEREQT
jgi:hypothetical protein